MSTSELLRALRKRNINALAERVLEDVSGCMGKWFFGENTLGRCEFLKTVTVPHHGTLTAHPIWLGGEAGTPLVRVPSKGHRPTERQDDAFREGPLLFGVSDSRLVGLCAFAAFKPRNTVYKRYV